ncbi:MULTISPECIES: conjugal transfer protein [Mycobacterium]|nr:MULTISPECIES: conjugal transfer protein [Mycobacterium]MDA3641954.1 conjugal transfer protein [Mycobacterium xenopi]MDA3659841.1 conjugal transfer protein [Mycobacterium xenopi]MDA3664386.1 conjugal transfer protein [Mycobacterium xenopi]SPX88431.1 Conjugative transposon protein TcpC [Mycobacterium xenopi]
MSFRPSPRARARAAWTRYRPDRRTVSRATVLACLALGAYGGMNAAATSCSPQAAVTPTQLDATINRSTAVEGFADAYVNVFLAGNTNNPAALAAFTGADITASALPVTVIKTAPWSATPQPSGFNNVDYWSVVVGAFVKPVAKAPELRFYQVPVAVILGAPRATSAPAIINGPDLGYDIRLAYPAQITPGGDAYQTIADFLTTWLTATRDHPASGDISRYSTSPSIKPFEHAPFTTISVQSIFAATDIPANASNGTTTRILVTAKGKADDRTEQTLTYPLTLTRQSNKWFISDIDLAPKLSGHITKATPTQATPTTTSPPKVR